MFSEEERMETHLRNAADRYAFEEAEAVLDAYALIRHQKGHKSFYRAYRKFKCLIALYAHVDFPEHGSEEQRFAWAWEDVDMAFRGLSENLLTGALLQLWTHTPKRESARFHSAICEALEAANEATSPNVRRRYLARDRSAPVRRGGDAFDLPFVLPVRGPKLRDWAHDNGFDAEPFEVQLALLEKIERPLAGEVDVEEAERDNPLLPTGWRVIHNHHP